MTPVGALDAALRDMTGAYHLERKHAGKWDVCQKPRCQNARLALEGRGPFIEAVVAAPVDPGEDVVRAEALLRRLVAVCDAASMRWADPVPPDAMPGGALHDAKEYLARSAPVDRVGGEPDMTEQTVPNATTTRERLANLIAQFERGHHTADEMPDLILRTMTRDRAGGEGLDVERLRKAIDLSGLGLIEGSDPPAPASDFAPQIAREYAAHTDAVDCPTCGSKFNPGDFRYYAHTDADGAEKALRRLMQSADDYEREAKARHAWDEGGAVETVIAGIQQYRAVLADKGGER